MTAHDRAPIEAIKARLRDPHAVARMLGLTVAKGTRPTSRVVPVLCPWHSEDTASCKLEVVDGVLLARCHGCKNGGDVLWLVGATMGLDAKRREDFPEVLRRAAELAGVDLAAAHPRAAARPQRSAEEELAEARREATVARAEAAYLRELLADSEACRITERTIFLAVARDALDGLDTTHEEIAGGFALAARLERWPGSVEDAASART